ncbi:hypothetical protein B0H16DRAFT_1698670 [Mycena metata]|uniref:Uncharacterized protein n=1 Tax=Mycena metata TaxID=1033252 RepID=A0AAD7MMZ6_9AGAR|nr:hypothetical protein B0H16DRAFT_1698670 [Mycena metata]
MCSPGGEHIISCSVHQLPSLSLILCWSLPLPQLRSHFSRVSIKNPIMVSIVRAVFSFPTTGVGTRALIADTAGFPVPAPRSASSSSSSSSSPSEACGACSDFASAPYGGPRVSSELINEHAVPDFNEGAPDSREFGHCPPTTHPPTSLAPFLASLGVHVAMEHSQGLIINIKTYATAEFNEGAADSKELTTRPPTAFLEPWHRFSLPQGSMCLWDAQQA